MFSSYDLFIEFILLPRAFVAHYIYYSLIEETCAKKSFVHLKRKVCATEKQVFDPLVIFCPLCGPTTLIHQWNKYGTMQKFFSFLAFLATLWTHNFFHHFYQLNYMFFFVSFVGPHDFDLFVLHLFSCLFVGPRDFCPFVLNLFFHTHNTHNLFVF